MDRRAVADLLNPARQPPCLPERNEFRICSIAFEALSLKPNVLKHQTHAAAHMIGVAERRRRQLCLARTREESRHPAWRLLHGQRGVATGHGAGIGTLYNGTDGESAQPRCPGCRLNSPLSLRSYLAGSRRHFPASVPSSKERAMQVEHIQAEPGRAGRRRRVRRRRRDRRPHGTITHAGAATPVRRESPPPRAPRCPISARLVAKQGPAVVQITVSKDARRSREPRVPRHARPRSTSAVVPQFSDAADARRGPVAAAWAPASSSSADGIDPDQRARRRRRRRSDRQAHSTSASSRRRCWVRTRPPISP